MKFVKIEGAGNTFLLLDTPADLDSLTIQSLCHTHQVDGLLHLVPDFSADCRMHYYNRDGTEGSMCGNGLRCVAFHLGKDCTIATEVGIRKGFCYKDSAKVEMGTVRILKQLSLDNRDFFFVDSGVPHALTFVPDVSTIDLNTFGPLYRSHTAFGPAGTNVSVVQKIDNTKLRIRIYERGVEAETGACGTAACAACTLLKPTQPTRYEVIPPSKMALFVEITPKAADYVAYLEGPCRYL